MNRGGRAEPTPPECAAAAEMFDLFCSAGTMKTILGCHRQICHTLNLKPNRLPDFYPKLKTKLASSWKAQALFKKFDARANHKVYAKGRASAASKVLVIGAGPCGLRAAIECQLLGAKVVVIEKRDRMSRNNVLHLWPFVIQDLRALGAKKFFGKFCAGSIDHISIRQLQCILLKVALLLGVEFHEGVSFEELLEPTVEENSETLGWRARVLPAEHPVSQYEFDVLLGADGKRNTLHGFKRTEFRGKLAMAITANFINRHSEQEASVPEISGVAFIFNQKFFKELYVATGIDLENIVYYKDDTHYFVMTAKKLSLIDKGVLINDYAEVSRLLHVDNVDRAALMRYAQEAARFSTSGRLPLRDFALNHYGEPDVALFDFTSMYAAENASLVRERCGRRLLCQLVGDSLLEPFWPTGSGCARGFLSALDAAWAVRTWTRSPAPHPLQVVAERESVFRLLAQTTPENLHRDFGAYTLDPGTRYPNLNRAAVTPHRVSSFYDSDDPLPLDATPSARKRRRETELPEEVLLSWVGCPEGGLRAAAGPAALSAVVRRFRPDLLPAGAPVHHVLHQELGITPFSSCGTTRDVPEARLRAYLSRVYHAFKGEVPHVQHQTDVFDQIKQSLQKEKHVRNTTDHSISAYSNAAEADKSHSSTRKKRRSVRPQHEEGRVVGGGRAVGGGARVAQLAAELSGVSAPRVNSQQSQKPRDLMRSVGRIERDDWNVKEIEKKIMENRLGRPEPKAAEKVPKWDREQFLVRQKRLKDGDAGEEKWLEIDETLNKLDQKLRDSGRPDHGTNKVANLATKFVKKEEKEPEIKPEPKEEKKGWRGGNGGVRCAACGARVFAAESVAADGMHLHRRCFRCCVCSAALRPGGYTMERYGTRLVCLRHSGTNVPDAAAKVRVNITTHEIPTPLPIPQQSQPQTTPERISLELSDGAREIDEDEWTDRNFLPSETSGAGGLSDDDVSSSDEYTDAGNSESEPRASPPAATAPPIPPRRALYLSDDSFGYDECSDDGGDSSGAESCSRMRAALEMRRREVPTQRAPPTSRSEVESEDEESESSEDEEDVSSGTEVSTDSEFARDEPPVPPPPAILVTEPPPQITPAAVVISHPLSRTRSAGGIATKRALELKRKYLLGEPSPPAVRRSDSTSQIDTKLEAFRTTITEFQKMLHPAPLPQPQPQPIISFNFTTEEKTKPMPDIIKNLYADAPVDLLTKGDSPLCKKDWREPISEEKKQSEISPEADQEPVLDLDSDSLSEDDSSHTATAPNQPVPRVEVHNEGGELIQLDSLTLIDSSTENNEDKASGTNPTTTNPTVVAAESDHSSESCRDATTLALTETELSDWAAESAVLDDCAFEDKEERKRNKNPRTLSGPKLIHDAKNISAISSHVCGRTSPEAIVYSNAFENFEFADEGEQDPFIETPTTPRNEGYMELVDIDDEYDAFSPGNDRSMNFIERSFSETVFKPASLDVNGSRDYETPVSIQTKSAKPDTENGEALELKSPHILKSISVENEVSDDSIKPNSPSKVELTPTKLELSPTKLELSPTKLELSSTKLELSPTKVELSPTKVELCPTKEENSPTKVEIFPTRAGISPTKVNSSPIKGNSSLTKANASLTKGNSSPTKVNSSPTKVNSSPTKGNSSPTKDDISLTTTSSPSKVELTPAAKLQLESLNSSPTRSKVKLTAAALSQLESLSMSDTSPPLHDTESESTEKPRRPSEPSISDTSPPLVPESNQTNRLPNTKKTSIKIISSPGTIRLYAPAICRSASETFNRSTSRSTDSPSWSISINLSSGSISPVSPTPQKDMSNKVQEIKREREEQTEVVRRLVLERLGSGSKVNRKSGKRTRASPVSNIPPPVPPPPVINCAPAPIPPPPPRPAPPVMPLPVTPSFSDPELAREVRRKSIMKSISNYLNRRLGPRQKEDTPRTCAPAAHKSTGALQEAPPVPPPPASYCPPITRRAKPAGSSHVSQSGPSSGPNAVDVDERDAMQLWFEARWARLVAQRRSRDEPREGPAGRRMARLERRLTRPLSAEQQAATVAELMQVSAQREAHQALMAADRRRSAAGGGVGD